jgi:hypothetical protein
VQVAPSFTWAAAIANSPPNNIGPFGNFILDTKASNFNASVTRLMGAHTVKWATTTTTACSAAVRARSTARFRSPTTKPTTRTTRRSRSPNAAIGTFQTYSQQSRWAEGGYLAINHEMYIQDNWKAKSNLTLDYGRAVRAPGAAVRLVRQCVELLPGRVAARPGTGAVCRGLRERRRDVLGHYASGHEPPQWNLPGSKQHARHRHARTQHR